MQMMLSSLSRATCSTLLLSAPNTLKEDSSITSWGCDSRNWEAPFTHCLGHFPGILATTPGLCGTGLQSPHWGELIEDGASPHQRDSWHSTKWQPGCHFVPPQSKGGLTPPSGILNFQHLQRTSKSQSVSPGSFPRRCHLDFLQRIAQVQLYHRDTDTHAHADTPTAKTPLSQPCW